MAQHDDVRERRVEKELVKYAALDDADINSVIGTLLEHEKGQKFLWWLLKIGKYGLNPFSPDPLAMAFMSGEMQVGSQIFARLIDVNPMGFAQLQMKRKSEDDRRTQSALRIADGDDLFASPGDDDSTY